MSGSGGSSSTGTGGIPGHSEIDCAMIAEKTILNSPDPDVLKDLRKNDVLIVTLKVRNGQNILVAETQDGRTAGSLTLPLLPRILECMGQAFEYVAIVTDILGGRCIVIIQPKARPT